MSFFRRFSNRRYRRIGDGFRNTRQWRDAEEAYREHLRRYPEDREIHVQLGHVLREQGNMNGAIRAYSRGADLYENADADSLGHLADSLFDEGQADEAARYYRLKYVIDRDSKAGARMGHGTKLLVQAEVVTLPGETTFFVIQDLLGYLIAHSTMSGIQRVQAGIANHAISGSDMNCGFILSSLSTGADILEADEFWLVDNDLLKRLIDYASGADVSHAKLRLMILECEDSARRVRPGKGDVIIMLGAFWGLGNTVDRYVPAHRAGVKIGAYIYDIIPITHPEFCDAALVADFTRAFCEACFIVDFILTISDYTRHSVAAFLERHEGRKIPMLTVPLAHSMTVGSKSQQSMPAALRRLNGRDFVAYVSTIEGRKNHLYVVNAWRQMIEEGVDVPDLVFVGRHGWRITALMDLLETSGYLGGKVHIVHDLTDAELNWVYARCRFTVFTSVVEGWGLPIGESLVQGTPCIASRSSSIPEVGGDFVDYVDPLNLRDGIEKFRLMIKDRDYLRARRQNISENFLPTTWPMVGADFWAKAQELAALPRLQAQEPSMREGELFRISDLAGRNIDLQQYVRNPQRLALGGCFYPPESMGSWMRGREGAIEMLTGLGEGTDITAYLQFVSAPWASDCTITVKFEVEMTSGAFERKALTLIGNEIDARPLRVQLPVGQRGSVQISISVEGPIDVPQGDTRIFAVGLRAMGFARSESLLARHDLLEGLSVREVRSTSA